MARILIYTLVFPPDQVSNAYVLANLVRGLRDLGHDLKVLTATPHYQPPDADKNVQPLEPYLDNWVFKSDFEGTPCYHVKVPEKKGGIFQRLLTAALFRRRSIRFGCRKEMECDVIIALTPPPTMGWFSSKIAARHRARSIFTVCDLLSHLFSAEKFGIKKLFGKLLQHLETMGFRCCDAVVCITPSSADYIRSQTKNAQIIKVIPDSVDTYLYRPFPRDNDYARQQGWMDQFVVSYVGNYGRYQDFSPLPQAVSACSDLNVKFICAGDGLKYRELVRSAEELGNPKWEVWGYQSIDTTVMINASSDLCLVLLDPKVTKGSFPSKLYTIMASGRPVLYYGPCDSDIARLIQENELGWTVETGDTDGFVRAVREAYADPERREQMGRNGMKLVEKRYSVQAVAKRYHDLIEKLLSES